MENIILTIHLILALGLIGVVLLQRSEGGGLGIGGGGGGGGAMSGRAAATALAKMTWILAIGFLITSLSLTVIAANNASGGSVLDLTPDLTDGPAEIAPVIDPDAVLIPNLGALPSTGTDATPAATPDAPATPPVSE